MKFRRVTRVPSRRIDDEMVLMPVRTSVDRPVLLHTLNPVGAFVWQLLDGEADVKSIVSRIVDEFTVSESVAERDVMQFLSTLEAASLIERADQDVELAG